MKLRLEVIEVRTNGETMVIILQGITTSAAKWRNYEKHEIRLPDSIQHRKAFYLGRIVEVKMRAV